MDYYESARGVRIDRARADREAVKHGWDRNDPEWTEWADREIPAGAEIEATAVLDWLGY